MSKFYSFFNENLTGFATSAAGHNPLTDSDVQDMLNSMMGYGREQREQRERDNNRAEQCRVLCQLASVKGWRARMRKVIFRKKAESDGFVGYLMEFRSPQGRTVAPLWPAYNKALAVEDACQLVKEEIQ